MPDSSRRYDPVLAARARRIIAVSAAAFALGGTPVARAQQAPAAPRTRSVDDSAAVAAFRRADTNKDGMLSKDEVAARLPAIAARFAEFDLNHDGSLSMEEFIAAYTAKE
jgi:hypothetical protein